MKAGQLMDAIIELSHERGLDQDIIIESLEDAIVGAAHKKYKSYRNIEAQINRNTSVLELMHYKTVVDELEDPDNQILLSEVLELDPDTEVGDEVEFPIDVDEFAPIIAQTARQLVFQKINEAEREMVLEKYKEKVGEIVHGQVARVERNRIVVMIGGNIEAMLERREQIPFENLQPGENIRAMLLDLKTEGRGPQLVLTRTHPKFLMKLMEVEVPEVFEGVIDVMAAAREPGRRAKVAVKSNDPDVDPVGACVGVRGSRIQAVVGELCGERIDVVEWSEELAQFISHALAPAEIMEMNLDEKNRVADIRVMMDQLSLAIGKQGQNVRLASKLTEVSININSFEQEVVADPFAEAEARAAAKEASEAEGVVADEATPTDEVAKEAEVKTEDEAVPTEESAVKPTDTHEEAPTAEPKADEGTEEA